MRSIIGVLLLVLVILPDVVLYLEVRKWTQRHWIRRSVLTPSIAFLLGIAFILVVIRHSQNERVLHWFMWFNWAILSIYIPKLLFVIFLLTDKLAARFLRLRRHGVAKIGAGLALLLFIGFIYGAWIGRFNIQMRHVDIACDGLPPAFDGVKIVQLSDIHLGSTGSQTSFWERAIQLINREHPDIIVFTGDFVNNFASELTPPFIASFGQLKAPMGKFSILGNHDYGDYTQWTSPSAKRANLDSIMVRECRMGFRLLLDEHQFIVNKGDTLVVAGVQNWSKPPFHCYGKLDKAIAGTERFPFVVLLSHDPNHWMAQVVNYPNIKLTLSGHTHAMQLGINWAGIHWSPAQWLFKQWEGLYHYAGHYLYVNRGLGYIGVPVRLGMPPEITVITLHS